VRCFLVGTTDQSELLLRCRQKPCRRTNFISRTGRVFAVWAASLEGSRIGEAVDRQLRVLARASLDGYQIGELQSRFPTMEVLLESVRERHSTELGARLAAAHTIALQLGWVLFAGFLRASTGLEDLDDRTFARSVGQTAALILDAEGPA
jgi:TetR/AcrR family transcriptional regulator, repressor for neighboring sulfatase